MSALRSGLLASVVLLPGAAYAQSSVTLSEISVVSTTPVGSSGSGSDQAAPPLGATPVVSPSAAPISATGSPRLRGGAQPLYKIPSTVETVTAADLDIDRGSFNAVATLARRTPGLNLSDSQGNSNRTDVSYRGFTASPVQGVPQGWPSIRTASASTRPSVMWSTST